MPPKVDPELKVFKKKMAHYKETEEFKERMYAIGKGIAAQAVANKKLAAQQKKGW